MPYILVRNKRTDAGADDVFEGTVTYIHCLDVDVRLQQLLQDLPALPRVRQTPEPNQRPGHLPYGTTLCDLLMFETRQPPYVVLDYLEARGGYKVVATSAMNDSWMWTLHRTAPY